MDPRTAVHEYDQRQVLRFLPLRQREPGGDLQTIACRVAQWLARRHRIGFDCPARLDQILQLALVDIEQKIGARVGVRIREHERARSLTARQHIEMTRQRTIDHGGDPRPVFVEPGDAGAVGVVRDADHAFFPVVINETARKVDLRMRG